MKIKAKQILLTSFTLLFLILIINCSEPGDTETEPKSNQFLLLNKHFVSNVSGGANDATMGFCAFQLADGLPTNWSGPVAYNKGIVYNRMKIYSKPSNELIQCQMGFQWNTGCSGRPFKEKFPDFTKCQFSSKGEIEWITASIPDWWEPDCQKNSDPIDWSKKVDRLLLVFRDKNNYPIDDRWGSDKGWDLSKYFPMEVHYQAVLVPDGEEFDGWQNYPDFDKTPILSSIYSTPNKAQLAVYPNPCRANETLTIEFKQTLAEAYIDITDVYGRSILNKRIYIASGKTSLKLPQLSSGSYVLNITANEVHEARPLIIR